MTCSRLQTVGSTGKTLQRLAQWLIRNAGACPIAPDMVSLGSLYDGQRICVVDVPRSAKFKNFEGLEQLKSAFILQTKYEAFRLLLCFAI
jgi:hypothetical protein